MQSLLKRCALSFSYNLSANRGRHTHTDGTVFITSIADVGGKNLFWPIHVLLSITANEERPALRVCKTEIELSAWLRMSLSYIYHLQNILTPCHLIYRTWCSSFTKDRQTLENAQILLICSTSWYMRVVCKCSHLCMLQTQEEPSRWSREVVPSEAQKYSSVIWGHPAARNLWLSTWICSIWIPWWLYARTWG